MALRFFTILSNTLRAAAGSIVGAIILVLPLNIGTNAHLTESAPPAERSLYVLIAAIIAMLAGAAAERITGRWGRVTPAIVGAAAASLGVYVAASGADQFRSGDPLHALALLVMAPCVVLGGEASRRRLTLGRRRPPPAA